MARVQPHGEGLLVQAASTAELASCPKCQTVSGRVHSRYVRRLSDAAVAMRPARLVVKVRRFFCDNRACGRKVFCESLGFADRHARRTRLAGDGLTSVALALGGRAGARLGRALGIGCSPSTLLRAIRRIPERCLATPRVLGVDDFALRRGYVYATVLVDIQTGRPVEVLPDRTADTLSTWLADHPGVEIICRDGSTAYAGGATSGAPNAVQVSDRWHLWRNLCLAVDKCVAHHRDSLQEPALAEAAPTGQPAQVSPPRESGLATRTRHRYAQVQKLLGDGVSRAAISRRLKLDPHTVRRFADAACVEELLTRTTRQSVLDEFKPYLCLRWNEGCTDAEALFREIAEQGFRGSVKTVRRFLQPYRAGLPMPTSVPAVVKARQAAGWIVTDPDNLKPEHRDQLQRLLDRSPALAAVAGHVREFAKMMKNLTGHDLGQWIARVLADDLPGLHSFVAGLQRDLDAVTAGLTLPWSSGPVEGHVNRIKMIKRQMYGRAGFDLLRKRVLHAH
ncbi:ISL3 family transposase [Catellatospora sp. NPDC049609]|uniref:ISL3 family transposase n=1 Tax=Catellatospora sp. NPDC049609 TaxID=3155505 RepID=UPI00342148B4